MKPILSQSYFISAGDTDAEQRLSLPTLTARIIDIATNHANSLGIGNPSMSHLGHGWVLSRLTIEMTSYPMVNDTFSISTWIEDWNRHFSLRDFNIKNQSGEIIGYARSVWMVINTNTHENAGLQHLHLPQNMIAGNPVPIPRQEKHRIIEPATGTGNSANRASTLFATSPVVLHTFGFCDLDAYRHVNTVRYVSLLLNQFTLSQMDKTMAHRLELSFLHEARYDEPTELLRNDTGQLSTFLLRDAKSFSPILYGRILRKSLE